MTETGHEKALEIARHIDKYLAVNGLSPHIASGVFRFGTMTFAIDGKVQSRQAYAVSCMGWTMLFVEGKTPQVSRLHIKAKTVPVTISMDEAFDIVVLARKSA